MSDSKKVVAPVSQTLTDSVWLHVPETNTHVKKLSDMQEAFLERISKWEETEAEACSAIGIHRVVVEEWKKLSEFVRRLEVARQDLVDKLEKEAVRRALAGVEEDVYYQGDVVGSKVNYSDALMQLLLKGYRPGTFTERREINANVRSFSIVEVLTSMKEAKYAGATIHQEGENAKEPSSVGPRLRIPTLGGKDEGGGDKKRKRSRSKSGSKKVIEE